MRLEVSRMPLVVVNNAKGNSDRVTSFIKFQSLIALVEREKLAFSLFTAEPDYSMYPFSGIKLQRVSMAPVAEMILPGIETFA